jgi:hypothetical protein
MHVFCWNGGELADVSRVQSVMQYAVGLNLVEIKSLLSPPTNSNS